MQFHLVDLRYRHTVTILDKSRVLFIKNMGEADRFTSEYGHNLSGQIQSLQSPEDMRAFESEYGHDLFGDILAQFSNYILWSEVAEKYTGIIVDPYFQEKSLTYLWYYGWNCAGGCIWDTSVIRLDKPCNTTWQLRKRRTAS